MKKNFLQDVVPASQKRSIKDIPLPKHKEKRHDTIEGKIATRKINSTKVQNQFEEEADYTKPIENSYEDANYSQTENSSTNDFTNSYTSISPKKQKKWSITKKLIATFVISIVGFIVFSSTQSKAEIIIKPKKVTQDVNILIPLDTNNLATKTQINKTATKTVPATGEQQVEKQASGKIKIINKHKQTPQELVKNTRFQAPNGLIYRIKDSIVVPGYTMNGNTIVPGTLEVEVFADSAGEDYNTSNITFTIPGFAGKEQFEKITAESIGQINGGYIGMRKVISEEEKEKIEEELKQNLKIQIEQIKNESSEYVLVPDLNTVSFGVAQDKVEGNNIIISVSAIVSAYSFVKKDLSNFIGQNSITESTSTDMFDVEMNPLNITLETNGIKISGQTTITWITDQENLKKLLINKKRSEISEIVDTHKSFEKIDTNFSPFWKVKLPSQPEKIEIIVKE